MSRQGDQNSIQQSLPHVGCLEGRVTFQIGTAFFTEHSRVARDLGVLAAIAHKSTHKSLRVLDVMAGCGVRSLRYLLEGNADYVWINDSNPEMETILQTNLQTNLVMDLSQKKTGDRYKITHWDANQVFFDCYNRRDFYDLVDVDCFGSPAPYLSTCLWATQIGGLIYLTSTDGRSPTGHTPQSCLSTFGAYARNHPAAHEQGLRLLIGSVQQQAAAKGLGVIPLFSLFAGEIYRVMLRLVNHPHLNAQNDGFLGYCHQCGEFRVIRWDKLGHTQCLQDNTPLVVSGPLWLGKLHDDEFLQNMMTWAIALNWRECLALLTLLQSELEFPPYFYTLGEIGRRGKLDIPGRSPLIQNLQNQGYLTSATHINPQAIKTQASLRECITVAKSL